MNKLLIICGPTATGKTKLGIRLAKKLDGEIISADSRQVYKGMDVGTGKDLPPNSKPLSSNSNTSHYLLNGIKIWGYDLTEPNADFSVAQYYKVASSIINDIQSRGKLSIIVGGTGLYIKALTQHISTISIPPNQDLRKKLESLSATKLQQKLKSLNPEKLRSMNSSDQKNPRRLIRAIEIASVTNSEIKNSKSQSFDQLWIGLTAPLKIIDQRIKLRVLSRAGKRMSQEINRLQAKGFDWTSNPATATGYRQWKDFLDDRYSKSKAVSSWITAEKQYARRQLTWFNKISQIHWFDITDSDSPQNVEQQLKAWYTKS